MENIYNVYWIRNGIEFERLVREGEEKEKLVAWVQKNAGMYGERLVTDYFKNGHWVIDYEPAADKGEVIRIADDKRFYFSVEMGLPGIVPDYVRGLAKYMTRRNRS